MFTIVTEILDGNDTTATESDIILTVSEIATHSITDVYKFQAVIRAPMRSRCGAI